MPYMSALHAGLICMPYMYALHVCPITQELVLSGGADGTLRLWSLSDGALLDTYEVFPYIKYIIIIT